MARQTVVQYPFDIQCRELLDRQLVRPEQPVDCGCREPQRRRDVTRLLRHLDEHQAELQRHGDRQ